MNIIIPCYIINEELLQLTKNTVESLSGHDLILIDNASPLGGGYLRSVAYTYIRNTENLGYAKAVNQGLKLVSDNLVAISNNDVRPSPNWEEVARSVFRENGNTYSCHFRMINYEEPYQYGSQTVYEGKERWCTSSFFVISAACAKMEYEPLLFDEQYGIGGYEDWQYWTEVREACLYTAYTDRACYQHHHSSTQNSLDQEERKERDKTSREYFKSKWGEYPEDRFSRLYPEQMSQEYRDGFQI